MKKLLKELSFYSLPFIALILLLFFVNIIKKDFTYGHFLHHTYKLPYNWFHHFTVIPINKFYIKLKNEKKEYLPQIRLYLSENKLNNLLKNLPQSTKNWQTGKIIHDFESDKLKNVKIRLRGDNPENWLLEKKSFRIKFRKKQMNGRIRYYNYLPFESRLLISSKLAFDTEVLAARVRPVELILNEEKKGLYLEIENLNENFLRRNKIMPVNFYKGENYNQETKIGLGNNLYSNPGLWSKEAYLNFYHKEYKDDLSNFLEILNSSKSNPEKFKNLKTFLDPDYFGRYLAYIILSQNYHTTKYHNNRIIIDPWKGQIFPVVKDPTNSEVMSLNLERSSNDLTSILNQNSEFLNLKYDYLNSFIFEEKVLDKQIIYLSKINKNTQKVLGQDPTKINLLKDILTNNQNYNIIEKEIENLKKRKEILIKKLTESPKVFWSKDYNNFSIYIEDTLPINKIELAFENKIPDWVFLDENYNNSYDSNEIKFMKDNNNTITLDVTLFANRLNISNLNDLSENHITTSLTKFNFVSSNKKSPDSIKVSNLFLKDLEEINLSKRVPASLSGQLNYPIFKVKNEKTEIITIEGNIEVDEDLIYEKPVVIKKGTNFILNKGANIIFKNKVIAVGTENEKITFKSNSQVPWGTIALLGKKTSGSIFKHIEMTEGSGYFSDQYFFSSMFSIHNTNNIKLDNILLDRNFFFDDMMHIVYASDIELNQITFKNANGDALDIDVCENILINNSDFTDSKNDGIDLMESNVLIKNVEILNSNDKGISIGEASSAQIYNSKLKNNIIGIAIKDGSFSNIKNVIFLNNKEQISAYKKNLQYGSGGKALVEGSYFKNRINKFISNSSKIKISDSEIIGGIKKTGEGISINVRK